MSDYIGPAVSNIEAERAVLGALIATPECADEVFGTVTPAMFVQPRHEALAERLLSMHTSGAPIDPVAVKDDLLSTGRLEAAGGAVYLFELYQQPWGAAYVGRHANAVRAAYQRRQLIVDVTRLHQMAVNPAVDMVELVTDLGEIADRQLDATAPAAAVGGQTVLDLLDRHFNRVHLIPNLLSRDDRYLFTGAEGLGKSEYGTQIVTCAVAGMHPFGGPDFQPLRVQVVDAENSSHQSQIRYRRFIPLVDKLSVTEVDWSNFYVENRPEGLSLMRPENVTWLRGVMQTSQPDILFIGSLYKLYRGANVNDEEAAGRVTDVLDDLRTRFNCAVIIEAHMGKGSDGTGRRNVTPRGSAAFMGWPEFGHGLIRSDLDPNTTEHVEVADIVRYRGDRVTASWPHHIRRGGMGELPWMALTSDEIDAYQFRSKGSF